MKTQYISDDGQAWDTKEERDIMDGILQYSDELIKIVNENGLQTDENTKSVLSFLIKENYLHVPAFIEHFIMLKSN